MNRDKILSSYYTLGGAEATRRRQEAYNRYLETFGKESGVRFNKHGLGDIINLTKDAGTKLLLKEAVPKYLGAATTGLELIANGFNQAQLDTDPTKFNQGLNSYYSNMDRALGDVSDNDGLLMAYDNYAPMGRVDASTFRNDTIGDDIGNAAMSAGKGAIAGSMILPGIGTLVGYLFGALTSGIGSLFGRGRAAAEAENANTRISNWNTKRLHRLGDIAEAVDTRNDLQKMQTYMNLNALGGPLSTHGADFSNGLIYVDNGGTHEENPLGGIPVGKDEQGTPDLVEQDEVIWKDYVFSDRIKVPEELCKKYKLKDDITFAEAVRTLTETSKERPNNPIDKGTVNSILTEFRAVQEGLRAEMQMEAQQEYQQAAQDEQDLLSLALAENGEAPIQFPQIEQAPAEPVVTPQESREGFAYGGNLFATGGDDTYPYPINPLTGMPMVGFMPQAFNAYLTQEAQDTPPKGKKRGDSGSTPQSGYSYGTWKQGDTASNWKTFSRGSVINYMNQQLAKYEAAKTPEEKAKIREETKNTINLIQTGYGLSYDRSAGKSTVSDDAVVRRHQTNWNTRLNGNAGFTNIAGATNLPAGHNSGDDAEHGWVDGLWGPYTSIRNAGTSELSPEDMKDLVEGFGRMDLDYTPTLDYGTSGQKLYLLSDRDQAASQTVAPQGAEIPVIEEEVEEESPVRPGQQRQPNTPNSYVDILRRAPIYGAGLGVINSLFSSPNYDNADAIIAESRRLGTPINIPVRTIGNYRTRRPFDERYLVNLAEGNRTNAMRTGMNTSGGNRAMQLGFASALAHRGQNELAEVMRQAYLANRADDAQVSEFNRGTDSYNASAINHRNLAQAQLNSHRQAQALSGLTTGYGLRQNIRDTWDRTTGQNLSNLFNQMGTLGKELAGDEMLYSLGAENVLPYFWGRNGQRYDLTFQPQPEVTGRALGGKLKKKRRF